MQRSSYLFTSESVSEGHPDKVCDRISDEVVDAFFRLGPKYGWAPKDLRVACETLATTNRVVIAGETRGPDEISKEILIDTRPSDAWAALRDWVFVVVLLVVAAQGWPVTFPAAQPGARCPGASLGQADLGNARSPQERRD